MAAKLAESTLVLTLDDSALKEGLAKIPGEAAKVAKSVESIDFMAKFAFFKELGSMASTALSTIANGIVEIGNRGAAVDDVASTFEVLTGKTGETADVMLGALRQGVVGTLSDFDLMVAANKTLGSGLIKTSDDMGVLAAGARALAKGTGGTTAEAFDTLTSAIASGRTATLKQIGAFVDAKAATENWAAAHKTTTSAMTDADRAQALAGASLAALKQRMKDIVPDAADFGELIDQAKVRMTNFKDQLAVGIAKSPAFAAGMAAMGKALDAAFGVNQNTIVAGLVGLVEGLAINTLYLASGAVQVGRVFASVFHAIEVLVNGALTVVVGFATGIVTLVDGIVQLHAALPVVGNAMKGVAATTSDMRVKMNAMTESLAKSTAEAAKGVIGQSALHEKFNALSGGIFGLASKMEHATAATEGLTEATNKQGDAAPVVAAKSQDMANRVAEAFRALNAEVVAGTKVGLEKRLFEIETAKQQELAKVEELKFETVAKHDEMVQLVIAKYRQRTDAAIASGDEIVNKERSVQNEIALLNTTGTANKLEQIRQAMAAELAALELQKGANEIANAAAVAAVIEKYRIQSEAAKGHFANVELAMAASGLKTRTELQADLATAQSTFAMMSASGEANAQALIAQAKKVQEAREKLDGQHVANSKVTFEEVAAAASSMLRSLFGKSKAAAIAAALIDASAAIVKGFAQGGIMGWVNAAVIGAATAAQINQIRSTQPEGFAQGTPNLDFADFGAQSFQPLHNQEAVIPRGGGHLLAGEIADSMPAGDEQLSLLGRIAGALDDLPFEMRKAFRNAMILDRA
jgi:hypothetical protein